MWQNHAVIFGKTQLTAAIATAFDFLLLVVLVEGLGVHYLSAVAWAAAFGGVVNYTLNRQWTFRSESRVWREALRYTFVCAGSLALNTLLVWFFTEQIFSAYLLSKVLSVLIVALFWNYPLHRYWVFRGE